MRLMKRDEINFA